LDQGPFRSLAPRAIVGRADGRGTLAVEWRSITHEGASDKSRRHRLGEPIIAFDLVFVDEAVVVPDKLAAPLRAEARTAQGMDRPKRAQQT
jgi:hypothetical protein